MSKSIIHIISQIKEDKILKNFIAKGNHKARSKAKKFLKNSYNKYKRREDKKICLNLVIEV